jgi:hypothetical protein
MRLSTLILILLFIFGAHAKRKTGSERAWKGKQKDCESKTCGHLFPDEAMNCVNQCTSERCYDEVFASEPLEDGEIDNQRSRSFVSCVRREARSASSQSLKKTREYNRNLDKQKLQQQQNDEEEMEAEEDGDFDVEDAAAGDEVQARI